MFEEHLASNTTLCGTEIGVIGRDCDTPLQLASKKHVEIARALIDRGASAESTDDVRVSVSMSLNFYCCDEFDCLVLYFVLRMDTVLIYEL
jgi:hypothetical protein